MILLSLLLFGLASSLCAALEVLKEFYKISVFRGLNPKFWNPKISYTNKWRNGNRIYGEKFFLSSTVLVFLTDAWHLVKFFYIICLSASYLLLLNNNIDLRWYCLVGLFFSYYIVWGVFFEVAYRNLKKQ